VKTRFGIGAAQNRGMYLRRIARKRKDTEHGYWALVESRRTARGPRQQVVAYLGDVSSELREGVALAASGDPEQPDLFESTRPEWVEIDLKSVRVERARSFGGAWLGLQLMSELGLDTFLEARLGESRADIPWHLVAQILIVHRLLDPSSELAIAESGYAKTALSDLLGVPVDKVNDDRLYRGLDRLLGHKAAMETHLKERLGKLFGLSYELLLYDLTSTFFEGKSEKNPQASQGYSRDNRADCKQVTIALVVSREGLPLGYEVFDGNRADVTTVEEIVETIEKRYGKADRIWAMDRGMVSEENIAFLQEQGRRYILGTVKSQLKRYERELAEADWETVREGLEVKKVQAPGDAEVFILCRSANRKEKDKAIHDRFAAKIEKGLTKLTQACAKRKLKNLDVERRIGRLLGQNTRAEGLFLVETIARPDGGTDVVWSKREDVRTWSELSQGCYMLRSNVTDWSAEDLWRAYMQLTQAEAAFRICKSDLGLRPVWHQKQDRVQAHILVCFLAFVLWKTLDMRCRQAGIGDSARKVLEETAAVQMVDVVATTKSRVEVRKRCVSVPEPALAVLLHKLKLQLPKTVPIPNVVKTEL
jgi:transposase